MAAKCTWLSEMKRDCPKSAHHGLYFSKPEYRAQGEVQKSCSYRPPELQYAERLLWNFFPMTPKNKLPTSTCLSVRSFRFICPKH